VNGSANTLFTDVVVGGTLSALGGAPDGPLASGKTALLQGERQAQQALEDVKRTPDVRQECVDAEI
jgi:hypothetical protein